MDSVIIVILMVVGFVSFLPVVSLYKSSKDMKYRCLKFLMNTTFAWTLLILVERLSSTKEVIYYAHMLGYPLKFLLSVFLLCTIYNYVEKKFPKILYYILGALFLGEYVLAITNNQTNFLLKLNLDEINSFKDLYTADKGSLFILHLVLTYTVVLTSIVFMVVFLSKNKGVRHYKSVTRTMMYSALIVLLFNLVQLIADVTTVDLTYISLVIVTYALYQVIYHQDMIFNLRTSGRGEILSNMREMYIITDQEKRIVEVSHLLKTKYKIIQKDFQGKPLDSLLKTLSSQIVFYEEYDVEKDNHPDKDHFHLREKKFTLKGINDFGYMVLMYDETQVFKLLRELNQLSNYDNMTGLHNRNFIENYLQTLSSETNYSVLSLDLNGLKANNDYLGHERGDFLLRELALKMKEVMAAYPNQEMARIGGDEFIIVLKDEPKETLNKIKSDILELCKANNILDRISVSIGVAEKTSKDESIYDLIKRADEDMYLMKSNTSKEYSKEIVKYATNKDEYIR